MLNRIRNNLALLALLFSATVNGQQPEEVRREHTQLQTEAQASQQAIEELDDETMSMVSAYNREIERYQDLLTYNENMRELLASQQAERERLRAELLEVETIRQEIVPLMLEMVEVLDQFIALDKPMLTQERGARIAQLKSIITRSDVDIAEKYRRIIEAYQIEAEYGQTLEAYEATTQVADEELTVDFLRVGRVALFYVSLDRNQAGIWDENSNDWASLPDSHLDSLDYALRVAREQAPPNLIALPLWTAGDAP